MAAAQTLSAALATAQGTAAQYDWVSRASRELSGRVLNERLQLHWMGDDDRRLWFRQQTSLDSHRFVLVDTEQGSLHDAFDHQRLANALSERTQTTLSPQQLPLRQLDFAADVSSVAFAYAGKTWHYDLVSETLETAEESFADTGLPPLRRLHASRSGGQSSNITFINERDHDVVLMWLDLQGQLQRYASVPAGQRYDQHTFEHHVWLVTDPQQQPLTAVEASAQSAEFRITPEATAPQPLAAPAARRSRPSRGGNTSPDRRSRILLDGDNVVLQRAAQTATDESETDESETEGGAHSNRFVVGVSETLVVPDGQGRFGGRMFWAPDSKYCMLLRTTEVQQRQVTMVDSAPDDQLQPRVEQFGYTKPGDPLERSHLYLCDIEAGTLQAIDDTLFDNPFSLNRFEWKADSSAFRFIYNQRGHQRLSVIEVEPRTALPRVVVENTSSTFVDYAGKQFLQFLDSRDELIWMSERDGWNHLYLIEQSSGETIRQLTQGEWVVRGVERVDPETRTVWVSAGGFYPDQDPYQRHLLRISMDDAQVTPLTAGDGDHQWEYSPTGKWVIDRYSRVDMPPVTELRRSDDGTLVCTLSTADWSPLLETGWRAPEPFVAKGRDGTTDIYGVIVRPHDFDPDQQYPVLESIYAGPHSAFVPKSFGLHRGLADLADLGFVVVKIDGMGTSHRSKAFHDVCWKNLADSGFPDRIAWLRSAAETYPQLDLTRVGIWGGSAGGQSALGALLNHGDFYHAAVADCGCHDNRMDKIWWNELWMGWPVGPHYADQSNVTRAHQLRGDLMLTVGELDHNVDPASTMQVVDALIKADKDFELVVFPGRDHGAGESAYGKRRRADFFVRKLWQREPRQ